MVRGVTALVTGTDLGDIKVTASEIGGGFGGKTTVYLEPVALLLAKKSGRPVKMVMTREEVFRATGPAPSGETRVKIGAKKDGTITAIESDAILNSGAIPGHEIMPATLFPTTCYRCDNARSIGRDVLTHRPRVYGYRAPGMSQPNMAVESVINELAGELGMDPIDFRLLNAVDEGDIPLFGMPFMQIGLKTALEEAKKHPHWQSELPAGQGRGVACAFWINAGMRSSATVNLAEDGSVTVLTGNPDIGGSRASMGLLAAEVLDMPVERINPKVVATDAVGYSDGAQGSRTTAATGAMVIKASQMLVDELKKRAATLWGIDAEQVTWAEGKATGENGDGPQEMSLAQIAASAHHTGGSLTFSASENCHNNGPGFSVNICDAQVDRDTGKVTITRYTCIQDAGKAVHPAYVEGQMQGGAAQGIGWALNEELMFNADGSLDNAGFLDYRIPVASDLPMLDTVIVEVPNPMHPFGIRGVGEVGICAPMPTVAAAVFQSAGVRIFDLPLTPPKLLDAMDAAGA